MMRLGPVPIASGAICAINEIGRMAYDDQGAFLDAMQEGKIPFSKYGFNMILNGSATFIMSANPTHDSTWRHTEKIDLSEIPVIMPLLDRIDLIFIFRITRDREAITTYALKKTESYILKDSISEQHEENKESDFLKKYILYSKRFNPRLSDEAGTMLCEYYIDVATKFGSPRVLDALFRISYAIARLKQKEVIDSEDAKEAIEFYNVQLQQQSEAVIIPKDPQELASEEIINTLRNSECPYDFVQLVKEGCRKNEAVSRYIGSDFSVETNKKLRKLRDKFKEGKEGNIAIVNQRPLVLAWCSSSASSYYDQSDNTNLSDDSRYEGNPVIKNIFYSQTVLRNKIRQSTQHNDEPKMHVESNSPTDQEKTEMISINNTRNHNADDFGRSDRSDRSVGYDTFIEDSSSIRTVNSIGGRFGCYYCSESFYSDLERLTHREQEHPAKLNYPTAQDFENRLNPNR